MVIASHRTVKTARDVRIPAYGESQEILKYLSVIVDESFSQNTHTSCVASRVYPKLRLLNSIVRLSEAKRRVEAKYIFKVIQFN